MSFRSEVAAWLARARATRGFRSEEALGKAAGLSRQTINDIANQRVTADESTLEKLAIACGVPVPRVTLDTSGLGARTAADWIQAARLALDEADRVLGPMEVDKDQRYLDFQGHDAKDSEAPPAKTDEPSGVVDPPRSPTKRRRRGGAEPDDKE